LREETVVGRPILELETTGGAEAGDVVTAETEETAQGEGFGALGDAVLVEAGLAFLPELLEMGEEAGGVFFKGDGGAWRRRSDNRLRSSTDHSTVSPRAKSMAWARAEGKLIYHCSLALRWMSWTLVGNPMGLLI
jgi:hypothetical protein